MSLAIVFLTGAAVGFGLGLFAGCMLAFGKTQDQELEGEHERF